MRPSAAVIVLAVEKASITPIDIMRKVDKGLRDGTPRETFRRGSARSPLV